MDADGSQNLVGYPCLAGRFTSWLKSFDLANAQQLQSPMAKAIERFPSSAPGPPKTGQVEVKIGPRPPKLRPRWPSCCHLGPSCCHLVAILGHLGRDFVHLGASFAGFFPKFVATSGEGSKNCPWSPSRPPFSVFLEPPEDDFRHFPRCVFFVFVSAVHLRFMLQFFFQIRFPAPEVNQRYASRL